MDAHAVIAQLRGSLPEAGYGSCRDRRIAGARREHAGHPGDHEDVWRVDHALALELWTTGIHEARILATLVADPDTQTEVERERWVLDITSWDLCDSAADLFGHAPAHSSVIKAWVRRPEAFVKRCAFSMIARRAVWAKQAPDREFLGYLPMIRRAATDDRTEVKKGVSWAIRQIGKRNRALHSAAIDEAEWILLLGTPSARWLARDALRELENEKTRSRLPDE